MKRARFSKVRITDYRPPGAGANPPVERDARPRAAAWKDSDHDKWVEMFPEPQVRQMLADLEGRSKWGADGMENRWVQQRIAALKRRLESLS